MKYKKKPVVIEAIQYNGYNGYEIGIFAGENCEVTYHSSRCSDSVDCVSFEIVIHTLEGDMHVSVGDYIIKGVGGEFYPCKPDIFHQTYEPIEE